ncbi:hypothetical protein C8F01DRAFT_1099083 [Mycena amicta]|nr:hypothetical protein C8F01DRAFT_1099083 [Mycena amicta]
MPGTASTPELRVADRTRLSTLDAQIEGLKTALDALCSERTLIQDRLAAYTYPVLTIPNEIVSEIFMQYIPIYPACPPLLGDGSPTKLAQICRHWREIAHATPMLWRAIELFLSDSLLDAFTLQLDTAKTWLERSRALPLSILIGRQVHPRHIRDASGALDHLMAHRTRWEYFMMNLPEHDDSDSRKCIEGPMPLLLELDLQFNGYVSRLDATIGTVIGTVDIPRLHTAFLDCSGVKNLRRGLLPWAQLTKLFLDFIDTRTAAMTLRETANLVHCRLSFSHETSCDGDILYLPRLETLIVEMDFAPSEVTHGLLLMLRTPVLKRLRMEGDFILAVNEHLPLVSVIRAFGCRLERLCIVYANQSQEEYKAALPQVAQIELVNVRAFSNKAWGHWELSKLHGSRT